MTILSSLRADPSKEREGVWVRIEGIRFKIALFKRGLTQEIEALPPEDRRRHRDGTATGVDVLELVFRTTADRVLLDWEDMQDYKRDDAGEIILEDGKPIIIDVPYSPEKALAIIKDPEFEALREELLSIAQDRSNFRRDLLEEARGN